MPVYRQYQLRTLSFHGQVGDINGTNGPLKFLQQCFQYARVTDVGTYREVERNLVLASST